MRNRLILPILLVGFYGVMVVITPVFFACSDDPSDPTATATPTPTQTATATDTPIPPLNTPGIISPLDGLKTSAHYPLIMIRDTNEDVSLVGYSMTWSDTISFDSILAQELCPEPDNGTIAYYPSLELSPSQVYYYKCQVSAPEYQSAETEAAAIFIETIGNNIPNRYLCTGDSITEWIPGSGTDYPSFLTVYLQDYFGATAMAVNEGIGGITSGALYELLGDMLSYHQPAYVIILIGINDIEWPQLCPEPYNCQTFEYIKKMVIACQTNGSIPIVCTLTPCIYGDDYMRQAILDLNGELISFCSGNQIDLIDLYTAFYEYDGDIADLFIEDGQHPNELGNQFMALTIFTYLSERRI